MTSDLTLQLTKSPAQYVTTIGQLCTKQFSQQSGGLRQQRLFFCRFLIWIIIIIIITKSANVEDCTLQFKLNALCLSLAQGRPINVQYI